VALDLNKFDYKLSVAVCGVRSTQDESRLASGHGVNVQVGRKRSSVDNHVEDAVALATVVDIVFSKAQSDNSEFSRAVTSNCVAEWSNAGSMTFKDSFVVHGRNVFDRQHILGQPNITSDGRLIFTNNSRINKHVGAS
jgi:hypothetical protein